MSSGRRTRVARPAQYTALRAVTPTCPRAWAYRTAQPVGTSRPAPRRTRTNPVTIRSGGVSGVSATGASEPGSGTPDHRRLDQVVQAGFAHPGLILVVLEDRAEGEVEAALVDLGPAEGGQSGR